jgi:CheY-like chemotaxis protein
MMAGAEGFEYGAEEGRAPPPVRTTVFVSDPSAEAERVAQLLRVAGYVVVDVPVSMLIARVAVQTPNVLIMDADASDVAETVARIREVARGPEVAVVLLGVAGGEAAL